MTVRERLIEQENATLSPFATRSGNSLGRQIPEPPCEFRTDFQRDRDRILHCKAFRRLKHKTQVYLAPLGDHYRTRLTHTLEVAQIGRTIARAMQLNEDLTEAVALGHDLGHTPFGHAGEAALNRLCPGGFRHYDHSVRIVSRLEKDGEGLNLTREVLDGIRCHTSGTEAFTPEGRIVRFADKIAYINHDIEDAVQAGVLKEEDLPAEAAILGKSKKARITTLVASVVENGPKIAFSPEINDAFFALHDFMFTHVYREPRKREAEMKAQKIIEAMFHYYVEHPDALPEDFSSIAAEEGIERAVCDYIAGMTDNFAIMSYKNIFLPEFWSEM